MKIAVVLIVKNEEQRIKKCLDSVTWADEIIVVDDGSTDKTAEIARIYTKHVFRHESKGYVEAARNYGLSQATGDFILLLDADEIVPATLSEELKNIAKEESIDFVRIPRKNMIFGEWIRHNKGWWPDYQLRFFRKGAITWPRKIHAQPEFKGKGKELVAEEKYALYHENYTSISQFLEKLDRYTTIESQEKKENPSWEEALLNPSDEFVSRFFAREGYKDGLHGLVLSLLEAMYAEVLFAKRWENAGFKKMNNAAFLEKNYQVMKKVALSSEYWYLTTTISNTKNPVKKARLILKRKKVVRQLKK